MNYYLILGHPTKDSFNGQICSAYEKKLISLGHSVRRVNIIDLGMDLNLSLNPSEKNKKIILKEQENIKWADEIIFFYPLWWGNVPALLKGYIDNVFQPGFAYKYHKNDQGWDKLLKGKTVRIFSTCDAPAWFTTLVYHNSDFTTFKYALCWFTGMKLKCAKRIGKVYLQNNDQRQQIIENILKKIK